MTLTLLLDLDDTLLVNDNNTFLPRYLDAFSRKVSQFMDGDKFIKALLVGTRAMASNRRPDCTLKETFEQTFYSLASVEQGVFEGIADDFYENIFPTLKFYTQPIPEAAQIVEQAFEQDFQVGIATNPLYPMTAIEQRLSWAELPVDRYPFNAVTSYETFHFAKPDPAYYAEILGRLGWVDGPVIMVGDDLKNDIYPARRLGIPAFWINSHSASPPDGFDSPTMSGSLADVMPWIDSVSLDKIQPDYNTPSAMLAILRSTPAVLDNLCRDLPAAEWIHRPSAEEWCLTEIVCHLRDVDADVNLPRIRKVLEQYNPFLPGEDTDPWAIERNYKEQDGLKALHQFTIHRVKLLDILETLTSQDWDRSARHAILGPTQLSELVSIISEHDRLHVRQARKLLLAISQELD